MREPRLEVADVFRTYEKEFFAQWGHVLSAQQRKAFEAIRDCRTAALGGPVEYVEECDMEERDTCGHRVIWYHSGATGIAQNARPGRAPNGWPKGKANYCRSRTFTS